MVHMATPDSEYDIFTEKYEFDFSDFLAYIGGYLVSMPFCLVFKPCISHGFIIIRVSSSAWAFSQYMKDSWSN